MENDVTADQNVNSDQSRTIEVAIIAAVASGELLYAEINHANYQKGGRVSGAEDEEMVIDLVKICLDNFYGSEWNRRSAAIFTALRAMDDIADEPFFSDFICLLVLEGYRTGQAKVDKADTLSKEFVISAHMRIEAGDEWYQGEVTLKIPARVTVTEDSEIELFVDDPPESQYELSYLRSFSCSTDEKTAN